MYELFTNIFVYIYILGPVTGSLPTVPQWAGTGTELVWSREHQIGPGMVWHINGLLPCIKANPFHKCFMNDTFSVSISWDQ